MYRERDGHTAAACRRAAPPLALVALLAAALTLGAAPAAARLSMTCVAGFEGWVKPGKWVPLFVTLENFPDPQSGDVIDFAGSLEFQIAETMGGPGVSFAASVDLPANSNKLITLYVMFTDTPRRPQLRLLRPGGGDAIPPVDVDAKTAGVRLIPTPEEPLVVVIEPSFAVPTEIPSALLSHRDVRVARTDGLALPDQWYGYETVDLVILPQYVDAAMTETQRDALVAWVRMGGRLLVMGGQATGSFVGSPFEPLLPASPLGVSVQAISVGGLPPEPLTLADATAGPAARVLASGVSETGREVPLGWMKREGLGEVHFWRFATRGDVGQRALRFAMRSMWESVFRQRYHDLALDVWRERFRPRLFLSEVFGEAGKPPWIALIIALIAIYFVAVGPANFIVLRRKRRLELVWITIPAIVIVFSVGMYLVGILTMGSQNIRRDVSLVQMEANTPLARVATLGNYFAAHAKSFDVIPASPDASFAPSNLDVRPSLWLSTPWSDGLISISEWKTTFGGASGTFEEEVRVVQGGRMEARDLPAPQWTWTTMESLSPIDLGGSVACAPIHRGTHLDGTLTNNTGYDLISAVLMVQLADPATAPNEDPGTALLPIGRLQKGGTVDLNNFPNPVRLQPTDAVPERPFLRDTTYTERLRGAIELVYVRQLVGNSAFPRGRAFLVALVDLGSTGRMNMMAESEESTHHGVLVVHIPTTPAPNVELPVGSMTVIPTRHDDRIPPERSGASHPSAIEVGEGRLVMQIESPFDPGTAELDMVRFRSAWRTGGGLALAFTLHDNSRPGGLPLMVLESAGQHIPVMDILPAAEYLDPGVQSLFLTLDGNVDKNVRGTLGNSALTRVPSPLARGAGLGAGRAELRTLQVGGRFRPATP